MTPTQKQAMQAALDDLVLLSRAANIDHAERPSLAALRAALAEPVVEPVVHPRHPVVVRWRNDGIAACAGIAEAYGSADAASDMRAMLTSPTPAEPVAEPVKFLANGTRFKMYFFHNEDSEGQVTEGMYVTCFEGFEDELDGRWVALVPAEDDCHMKLKASPPPAEVPLLAGRAPESGADMPDTVTRLMALADDYMIQEREGITGYEARQALKDELQNLFVSLNDELKQLQEQNTALDAKLASYEAAEGDSVVEPVDINQIAAERYKVVPAHESMFHRWAVVAGNGTQQLYLGREVECQNMARKFAGAFLDGAYLASPAEVPLLSFGEVVDAISSTGYSPEAEKYHKVARAIEALVRLNAGLK